MRDPSMIIVEPRITEKSAAMSYGDPRIRNEADLVRKYTFVVARDANKIEIKQAIEAIYNVGKKKKEEKIEVVSVRTMPIKGKRKRNRVNPRASGMTPDRKKAIVTLAKGQLLEDYGV
ncbi:MAG: 50S ribosomal protein L23 [Fimbriimonadaceae bacterium]